jgi:hypothetical protein
VDAKRPVVDLFRAIFLGIGARLFTGKVGTLTRIVCNRRRFACWGFFFAVMFCPNSSRVVYRNEFFMGPSITKNRLTKAGFDSKTALDKEFSITKTVSLGSCVISFTLSSSLYALQNRIDGCLVEDWKLRIRPISNTYNYF